MGTKGQLMAVEALGERERDEGREAGRD